MERPEQRLENTEGNEEELAKAAEALNLDPSLSWNEIGEAYFRFNLAQEYNPKNKPDKEEIEKAKKEYLEKWNDSSFRESEYEKYGWVGEKIRKAGEENKRDERRDDFQMAKPMSLEEVMKYNPDMTPEQIAEYERWLNNEGTLKQEFFNKKESRDEFDKNNPDEINYADISQIPDDKLEEIWEIMKGSLGVVVHGETSKIRKGFEGDETRGNYYIGPDFDSKMAAYLFSHVAEEAGSTLTRAVTKGSYIKGAINCDTGHRPAGVTVNFKTGTIFIDHHGEEVYSETSATQIAYELLDRLGRLKLETEENGVRKEIPKEVIKKVVDFSTENDNLSYLENPKFFDDKPFDKKYYTETWWQTLYANKLYEKLPANEVIRFFEDGNDPRVPISQEWRDIIVSEVDYDDNKRNEKGEYEKNEKGKRVQVEEKEGKKIPGRYTKTIGELIEEAKRNVDISIKGIKKNEAEMANAIAKKEIFGGRVFDDYTPELGRILINELEEVGQYPDRKTGDMIKKYKPRMPGGAIIAARALGNYDTVITWDERNKSIKVESLKDTLPLFKRLEETMPKLDGEVGIVGVRKRMIIDVMASKNYEDSQKRGFNIKSLLDAVFSYPDKPSGPDTSKAQPAPPPGEKTAQPAVDSKAKKQLEDLSAGLGIDLAKVGDSPGADWFAIKSAIAKKLGIEDIKSFNIENFRVPFKWIDNLSKDIDLSNLSDDQRKWIESMRNKLDIKIDSEPKLEQEDEQEQKKEIENILKKIDLILQNGNKKTSAEVPSGIATEFEKRLKVGFIWSRKKEGADTVNFQGIMRKTPKKT